MKLTSIFFLNFEKQSDLYYNLLLEEDFEFKTKDISIDIEKVNKTELKVSILAKSVIDMKIAVNAFMKSLEVIEKTLNI